MKFKVGDRVNVIPGEWGYGNGTVVEVRNYRSEYPLIRFDNDPNNSWWIDAERVKKIKGGSMKKLSWAVKYDKDVDPTEYFETKKDAMERIEELVKESDVSNIVLFHIDKSWTVKTPIKFELEEVK